MPYSREEVRALYDQPLLPLLDEARRVHTANHPDNEVQLCTLLSVKTGGCPEDCAYCTQSSHYETSGSGGIIGMGESPDDRCEMLRTLANLTPQPESVPINALVPMAGTPLANAKPVDPLDLVRMIAVARILMPMSRVRLSAGRQTLSREAQMLCMLAGANSIFYGEKLLTAPNPEENEDLALLRDAGLQPMPPRTTADA